MTFFDERLSRYFSNICVVDERPLCVSKRAIVWRILIGYHSSEWVISISFGAFMTFISRSDSRTAIRGQCLFGYLHLADIRLVVPHVLGPELRRHITGCLVFSAISVMLSSMPLVCMSSFTVRPQVVTPSKTLFQNS